MRYWLQLIAWLACVVYSTIPAFWFMIHPFAERWRARHLSYQRSPYMVLLPVWMVMWAVGVLGGGGRAGDAALAGHLALPRRLAVGRGGSAFRRWILCLFAIRKEFQREAARRAAGSSWQESRAATGYGWNPVAGAASGVPGASLRNAGMERGNRTRGVLGTDGVRHGHGSGDDPDGGCGVGAEVWRLLSRVSEIRASGSAASVRAAPAIIRSD